MLEAGSGSLHDSLTTKAKQRKGNNAQQDLKKGANRGYDKNQEVYKYTGRDDNKMETGVMIGNGKHKVGEELERELRTSAAMASTRITQKT